MATQHDAGVEFSLVSEEARHHFRLLELPPELLSILTENSASQLYLKSQDAPSDGTPGSNNIVLCTSDQTYSVRQVSTSNTLLVARPSRQPGNNVASPGIDAIAQCSSTLEVRRDSQVSATPYLLATIPIYTSTGHHGLGKALSKQDIFDSMPLSNAECERDWTNAACFELEGVALRPSDSVKLQAWQALLTTAMAQSIDLSTVLSLHDRADMIDSDSERPAELLHAILNSVSIVPSSNLGLEINSTKLVQSIGLSLLKDRTDDGLRSTSTEAFLTSWADLMPERWRGIATINALEGSVRCENNSAEVWLARSGVAQQATSTAIPADARTGAGATRKWHEKFRAAKKAG